MDELLKQLTAIKNRVKDLEAAFLRIKNLVFPTGSGRFSPPKYAGDPASPIEGDVWYNTTTHKLRVRTDSTSVDLH